MKVCVFLGAHEGHSALYRKAAENFSAAMVKHDATLVYGGANVGLMGLVANTLLEAGKHVIGVVPTSGLSTEIIHSKLSECIYTPNMESRQQKMIALADAFVALPGGLGTFEEIFKVWNAIKLKTIQKPLVLLNINNYFSPLLNLMQHAISENFAKPEHLKLIHTVDTVEAVFSQLIGEQ